MNEQKRGRTPLLPATITKLDLGRYPLGSPESRATARHLVSAHLLTEPEGVLMRLTRIDRRPSPDQVCHCEAPPSGTFALCECFIGSNADPDGNGLESAASHTTTTKAWEE